MYQSPTLKENLDQRRPKSPTAKRQALEALRRFLTPPDTGLYGRAFRMDTKFQPGTGIRTPAELAEAQEKGYIRPHLGQAISSLPQAQEVVGSRLVQRPQWDRTPAPTHGPVASGRWSTITLHHTGRYTTPGGVEFLHRGGEKWRKPARKIGVPVQVYDYEDIGYHFLISENGTIFEGRPMTHQGAHVVSHNVDNIGIAFLGNYTNRRLSDAQMTSARALIRKLQHQYGVKRVLTHRELSSNRRSELAGAAEQIETLR